MTVSQTKIKQLAVCLGCNLVNLTYTSRQQCLMYSQYKLLKNKYMIRRTTPNKSFINCTTNTSCCRWFEQDQNKHQLRITLDNKPRALRLTNYTSHCSRKEDGQTGFQTPTKPSQPLRKSSGNSNQFTWGTARTTVETNHRVETLITLPSSMAAKNPLERLHRFHKKNPKAEQKLIISTTAYKPICFSYVTPRKQVRMREEMSTAAGCVPKLEQPQGLEENKLKLEIQTYRREYQQLLNQYNQLRKRKQTNLTIYKDLLAKLKAKKDEIAALQKLRKQQIEALRLQIQQVIAEREKQQQLNVVEV